MLCCAGCAGFSQQQRHCLAFLFLFLFSQKASNISETTHIPFVTSFSNILLNVSFGNRRRTSRRRCSASPLVLLFFSQQSFSFSLFSLLFLKTHYLPPNLFYYLSLSLSLSWMTFDDVLADSHTQTTSRDTCNLCIYNVTKLCLVYSFFPLKVSPLHVFREKQMHIKKECQCRHCRIARIKTAERG